MITVYNIPFGISITTVPTLNFFFLICLQSFSDSSHFTHILKFFNDSRIYSQTFQTVSQKHREYTDKTTCCSTLVINQKRMNFAFQRFLILRNRAFRNTHINRAMLGTESLNRFHIEP